MSPCPVPAVVSELRAKIQQLQAESFIVIDGVCLPDPEEVLDLWTEWRSRLTPYAPPEEAVLRTKRDVIKALDLMRRRLEELFGPPEEARETWAGLDLDEVEGGAPDFEEVARPMPPLKELAGSSPRTPPVPDLPPHAGVPIDHPSLQHLDHLPGMAEDLRSLRASRKDTAEDPHPPSGAPPLETSPPGICARRATRRTGGHVER
jgi:hypothetical protein